jgi:hypothetical protein
LSQCGNCSPSLRGLRPRNAPIKVSLPWSQASHFSPKGINSKHAANVPIIGIMSHLLGCLVLVWTLCHHGATRKEPAQLLAEFCECKTPHLDHIHPRQGVLTAQGIGGVRGHRRWPHAAPTVGRSADNRWGRSARARSPAKPGFRCNRKCAQLLTVTVRLHSPPLVHLTMSPLRLHGRRRRLQTCRPV